MQNPFEALGKNKAESVTYDEWGGSFECQSFRCRSTVGIARYYAKDKTLRWTCEEGHKNIIEGVEDE